jgi:ApaG protein
MLRIKTHNIEISVEARYWSESSVPKDNHYFFIYFITIENKSDFTVQLTKRHWDIFDSVGDYRVVDGEGVVGETPVLEPGKKFEYNSGCNLTSEMGCMKGYYTFLNMMDNREFRVEIPKFELIVPARLN